MSQEPLTVSKTETVDGSFCMEVNMEILKRGDADHATDKKEFSCDKCGCVFAARRMEYQGVSQMEWLHHNASYKCKCPTCGNMVYR